MFYLEEALLAIVPSSANGMFPVKLTFTEAHVCAVELHSFLFRGKRSIRTPFERVKNENFHVICLDFFNECIGEANSSLKFDKNNVIISAQNLSANELFMEEWINTELMVGRGITIEKGFKVFAE